MTAERRLVMSGRIDGTRDRAVIRLKGYPTPEGPTPYMGLVATKPEGVAEAMGDLESAVATWTANPW